MRSLLASYRACFSLPGSRPIQRDFERLPDALYYLLALAEREEGAKAWLRNLEDPAECESLEAGGGEVEEPGED